MVALGWLPPSASQGYFLSRICKKDEHLRLLKSLKRMQASESLPSRGRPGEPVGLCNLTGPYEQREIK